jgi:hypothetical protein
MVTDRQVRKLFELLASGRTLASAAERAGMHRESARRYRRLGKLPSEVAVVHDWRTREDPFEAVWDEAVEFLEGNAGLEAKTIFDHLQRKYAGRFQDGQLRTFQRRVKMWRATEGPGKEVFFAQVHEPGKVCQSDFANMNDLGVRIGGQAFDHLVYHFVLTYSNWESHTVCFSESFESLSEGLQNALWELGGVPLEHQTDRLSAAVNNLTNPEEFARRYEALLGHYGLQGRKTNPSSPNENGDVEQRHHRFRRAVDQALMLRGSRQFETRSEYEGFLKAVNAQLNSGREVRRRHEMAVLRPLPSYRLESWKRIRVRVRSGSLITVGHNAYSVPSRLIGERVDVRLYAEYLEVWYGQRLVESMPRLRGRGKHRVEYRHIIDWLVRKPGAFENYRYREEMFPTSRFRMSYDALKQLSPAQADRHYLEILQLAAREGEVCVDDVLRLLLDRGRAITLDSVREQLSDAADIPGPTEIFIEPVDLTVFDELCCEAVLA